MQITIKTKDVLKKISLNLSSLLIKSVKIIKNIKNLIEKKEDFNEIIILSESNDEMIVIQKKININL